MAQFFIENDRTHIALIHIPLNSVYNIFLGRMIANGSLHKIEDVHNH
jgi:hypothetical protein